MSKETIWFYFKRQGITDEAIAALMGNLECESNCEPCRVQNDFDPNRSKSKEYARQVSGGVISAYQFINDQRGWGLAQWTYFSRKQNLLEWCWNRNCGIDDLQAQLDFIVHEMETEFPTLWNLMHYSTDINQVSDLVCRNYENPAVKNFEPRRDAARTFYNQFHDKVPSGDDPLTPDPDYNIAKAISLLEEVISLLKGGS